MNEAAAGESRASQLQVWQQAWQFYRGQPPRPFIPRKNEPDDNLILSFGRLIVNKGVSYLFGKPVTSEVTGTGAEPRQAWLDECWRRNRRDLFLQKLAVNGGVTGQAFAKIVPPTSPAQGNFPRVVVLDTQLVDVVYADDDLEDVSQYTITIPPVGGVQKRQLIARDEGGAWTISDQVLDTAEADGDWQVTAITAWPWDFPPIVECQNLPAPNCFWGESDLSDDVCHILLAINRNASAINKIIRVHAYPKPWTKGLGARPIKIGIDEIINLPSDTAQIGYLEMASDLAGSIAFLDKIIDTGCWLTSVPRVAFGDPDDLGAVSGVSMQLRFAPLLEKTEGKRLTYGGLIQELDRRLLALGGFGEYVVTQLHWPELLPSDPLQERQVAVLDDSLGVSTETVLDKLGYDAKQEQARRKKETAANTPPQLQPGQPGQQAPGQPAAPGLPVVPPPAPLLAPLPATAKG